MIIIKEINLINFLSHKKTVLEAEPVQKILIDGISGSGKSSIIEALVWGLYGKGRSDNKSLVKKGSQKATVTIILQDDETNTKYKIERSISSSNKHDLSVRESVGDKKFSLIKSVGIRGAQEYIEETILHASYMLFINSSVYLQNNEESFIGVSATKRKDILLEIVNASCYDEYLKKAKEEIAKHNVSFEVLEDKVGRQKEQLDVAKKSAEFLSEYEVKDKEYKTKKETLVKEESELLESQKENIKKDSEFSKYKENILASLELYDKKSLEITSCNETIDKLSSADIDSLKKQVEELKKKKDELATIEQEQSKLLAWNSSMGALLRESPIDHNYDLDIEEINKQIIQVMTDEISSCPKCGYINPLLEENRNAKVSQLKERLIELSAKKKEHTETKDSYTKKVNELGDCPKFDTTSFSKLKSEIVELEKAEKELLLLGGNEQIISEKKKDINNIKAEMENIKSDIEKYEKELGGVEVFEKERKEIEEKLLNISSEKNKIESSIQENGYLLAISKNAKEDVDTLSKTLTVLSKERKECGNNIKSLEAVKGAFGPNGIKSLIIDYAIPQLEEKINNILETLSDFRVKLETQRSGAGKDVVLEGLFINIINDQGEELDFSNFSGGERVKISTSINEALASLSKIGFRILDETIVALDNDSLQSFMITMNEILMRVNQVICISHIQEIKDMFDEKKLVTKIGGDSVVT